MFGNSRLAVDKFMRRLTIVLYGCAFCLGFIPASVRRIFRNHPKGVLIKRLSFRSLLLLKLLAILRIAFEVHHIWDITDFRFLRTAHFWHTGTVTQFLADASPLLLGFSLNYAFLRKSEQMYQLTYDLWKLHAKLKEFVLKESGPSVIFQRHHAKVCILLLAKHLAHFVTFIAVQLFYEMLQLWAFREDRFSMIMRMLVRLVHITLIEMTVAIISVAYVLSLFYLDAVAAGIQEEMPNTIQSIEDKTQEKARDLLWRVYQISQNLRKMFSGPLLSVCAYRWFWCIEMFVWFKSGFSSRSTYISFTLILLEMHIIFAVAGYTAKNFKNCCFRLLEVSLRTVNNARDENYILHIKALNFNHSCYKIFDLNVAAMLGFYATILLYILTVLQGILTPVEET